MLYGTRTPSDVVNGIECPNVNGLKWKVVTTCSIYHAVLAPSGDKIMENADGDDVGSITSPLVQQSSSIKLSTYMDV